MIYAGGNKYHLVVEMQHRAGIVWVKFTGNDAEYDRIDVENVKDYSAHPKRQRPAGGVPPARIYLPGAGAAPHADERDVLVTRVEADKKPPIASGYLIRPGLSCDSGLSSAN